MAKKQNQDITAQNPSKAKLNKSHIQGFILGVLVMAILSAAGLILYFSFIHENNKSEDAPLLSDYHDNSNPEDMPLLLNYHYYAIKNFDEEVLNAKGNILVFFNNTSLSANYLSKVFDQVYYSADVVTKIYNLTQNELGFVQRLGINHYDLPCFAMFENGKVKGIHTLDLKDASVVEWIATFCAPKIYRAFPRSASNSVGTEYKRDYYTSELILMPELPQLTDFIKLSGNITLPTARYSYLYSLLGDTFGGDGKTSFGLPNLESQIPQTGLRYFMCEQSYIFPDRLAEERVSYVDGDIKYLEFDFNELNNNSYIGQVVLGKNIDEDQYGRYVLPCDGREISMREYPVLASLIENKFGGDGVEYCKLPDLTNVSSPIKGAKYYIMLIYNYPT